MIETKLEPCCERCWNNRGTESVPTKTGDRTIKTCVFCGEGTYAGIVVKVEPHMMVYSR